MGIWVAVADSQGAFVQILAESSISIVSNLAGALKGANGVGADGIRVAAVFFKRTFVFILAGESIARISNPASAGEGTIGV